MDPNEFFKYTLFEQAPKVRSSVDALMQGFGRAGETVAQDAGFLAGVLNDPRNSWIGLGPMAKGLGLGAGILGQLVYHGSPHKFDKFLMSKVGTGSGGNYFGHGLYFTDNPQVAQMYGRNQYVADIPGRSIGQMLDWDKPLSQQPDEVRTALQGLMDPGRFKPGRIKGDEQWHILDVSSGEPVNWMRGFETREAAAQFLADPPGSAIHQFLRHEIGDSPAIADALRSAGVPGIKYMDQEGRAAASSYTVFDDNLPVIKERR